MGEIRIMCIFTKLGRQKQKYEDIRRGLKGIWLSTEKINRGRMKRHYLHNSKILKRKETGGENIFYISASVRKQIRLIALSGYRNALLNMSFHKSRCFK